MLYENGSGAELLTNLWIFLHPLPSQILRLPEPKLGLGQGFAQNDLSGVFMFSRE
jgi:hypothetical protein